MQQFRDCINGILNSIFPLFTQEIQALHNRFTCLRVDLRKGHILQLFLHLTHPDAFSQRRIDLHGFLSDTLTLFRFRDKMQCTHIMQSICKLHQQHAQIFRHRHHELTEIFSLLTALRFDLQTVQLGHTIDQITHFFPKKPTDLL